MTRLLHVIGPGLLVAATGVGAGDLATAGYAGSQLGTAILWAVLLGGVMKYVLTEGLARWQIATGETLLEGLLLRFGRPARVLFLFYFLPWSFFVGAALISACGVTGDAILRAFGADVPHAKIIIGAAHSALGLALVWKGGFRLVERLMAVCVAAMFVTVMVTAFRLGADPAALARGIFIPTIPQFDAGGLTWTIGLMGGVGGTLTILCYGYWMREEGRGAPEDLRTCRLDLSVGYLFTVLFGMAMLVIASHIPGPLDARGATLIVALSDRLAEAGGTGGRLLFLVGAWAAVFSSLLGVWQAVPYLFADVWTHRQSVKDPPGDSPPRASTGKTLASTAPYRWFLLAIATIPLLQVQVPFREVQKLYVIVGALFIPALALVELIMNGRREWAGRWTNRPWTVIVLLLILIFFLIGGILEVRSRLG